MITWIHNVFVIPHEESFDFAKLRFDFSDGMSDLQGRLRVEKGGTKR